jgi:hypothetical protein
MAAHGLYRAIEIKWINSDSRHIGSVEIWESETDDRSDAELIQTVPTTTPGALQSWTRQGLVPGDARWYWIRHIDLNDTPSTFYPPSAVAGWAAVADGLSSGDGATSVSNTDGTLTISPTTGDVVASLNLNHVNTWTQRVEISFAGGLTPSSGVDSELGGPGSTLLQLAGGDLDNCFISWHTFAGTGLAGGSASLINVSAGGTNAVPAATPANWPMLSMIVQGHQGGASGFTGNQAAVRLKSLNAWTGIDHSTVITFHTTPSGSTVMLAGANTPMQLGSGLSVGTLVDPSFGYVNAFNGYKIANVALAASHLSNGVSGTGAVVLAIGAGLSSVTPFSLRDSSAGFNVTITPHSTPDISAGRILTLDMGNVNHTLDFGHTAGTITFPDTAADTVALLGMANIFTALMTLYSTSGAGSAQTLLKLRTDGGVAGNGPALDLIIKDNTPADVVAGRIAMSLTDGTAGSLDADMVLSHMVNGTLINHTLKWGTTSGTITFPATAADTVAMLAVANAFTAGQSITMPSTGPALTLSIADPSTAVGGGATFTMFNTDTTVNNRSAFSMSFANSTGAANEAIVRLSGQRTVNTVGAQTGHLDISTREAGTVAIRLTIGPGVQVGIPTGGDKGDGTINVKTGYYANGTAGVTAGPYTTITSITVTNGIVTALTGS